MDIVVIGAGSVGMLIASYLVQFNPVTLLVRNKEQLEEINHHGLCRVNINQSISQFKISVTTELNNIEQGTVVIIATKYKDLQSVYPLLKRLPIETPLLFLQNGLAHFEEAIMLPQKNIAFGSCQFGAQKINAFTVVHRGIGVLKFAVERGEESYFDFLKEMNQEDFPIEQVKNAERMLFEKAILNCFINPLTAILNVKNGFLINNKYTEQLLKKIYKELCQAFPLEMNQFHFEDVINLCMKTATNTSSMLGDFLHGRPTEVETILGAIIRKAQKNGKELPTLLTLYNIIKALEERSDGL